MTNRFMRTGLAALLTTASVGAIASSAYAQDVERIPEASGEEEDAEQDVVVVTGSRIRRDEFSSSGPVQVIDPRIGALQGVIDTAALIQSSSIASGSAQATTAISSSSYFTTNGGKGSASVSLRGLGAERTLVLLNGRRAGPAGTRGTVNAFDLNVLPSSIISNVEILKDGASSVYGSDAVAGVVNIITKRDTEGVEFDFYGSMPFEGGGEEYRASGTWGKTFDRGHLMISGDYYKRKELARGDRQYLNCGEQRIYDAPGGNRVDLIDPRTGEYKCSDAASWGHVWIYDLHYYDYAYGYTTNPTSNIPGSDFFVATQFQYNYAGDNLQDYLPNFPGARDSSDLTIPAGWYPVNYDSVSSSLYNDNPPFVPEVTVIPETTRYTAYIDGAYELTPGIEAYGEFLFNRRETYQNDYAQFWNFSLTSAPNSAVFYGAGPNPFDSATGPYLTSSLPVTNHADSSQTVDYYRGLGGLRGEIESGFLDGWSWDVYSQYSRSRGAYRNDQVYQDSIDYQYSIGYGYFPDGCEGVTTPVSQKECVTIDWWDPEFLRGNIPQEYRDYLFGTEEGRTIYTQFYVEGIATGNIFELPAGPLGAAFGATWRREKIDDLPGSITYAPDPNNPGEFIDNSWTGSASGHTTGQSETAELFGEFNIPLLHNLPGIEYFEIGLAGRLTDVSTVDGLATTWKASANWAVTDWLRLGGTIGTSFRAPALYELYLANQKSFDYQRVIDPCVQWGVKLDTGEVSQRVADNCAAQGVPANHPGGGIQAETITGGGIGVLEPETSTAKSASVTLTLDPILPESTRVSMRADYFDIEVKGEIAQLGGQAIIYGCLSSDYFPSDPLCDLYQRGQQGNSNNIATVNDSFININNQRSRGLDFTLRVDQELPRGLGALQVIGQATVQLTDRIELYEGTVEDLNGEEGEPKFTGTTSFIWSKNDWSLFWDIDYIGSTSELEDFDNNTAVTNGCGVVDVTIPVPYCVDVYAESVMYHSASISKSFNDGGIVAILGVTNLFDKEPPRVSEFDTNRAQVTNLGSVPFQSQYDFIGRRIFLNLKAAF